MVFSSGVGDGRANQFERTPESEGPPLGAEGPLELMKGPEAHSDEKELPNAPIPPPPIVPKRTLSYRGSPERMTRSSKHMSGPLND